MISRVEGEIGRPRANGPDGVSDLPAEASPPPPGTGTTSRLQAGGKSWERVVVRTHWIEPGEDMSAVMAAYLGAHRQPGDWGFVSEKALVISRGDVIPASAIEPGRLARLLARWVRPTFGSRGLSIPEKMQLVIDTAGQPRVLAASLAAALTRPFGIRGGFYVVAGQAARGMDGMRPPLEHLLIPPLGAATAHACALDLSKRLAMPVAIVDLNDRGGSVRAVSDKALSRREIAAALRDNPLGQRDRSTPIGLLRDLDRSAAAQSGDP